MPAEDSPVRSGNPHLSDSNSSNQNLNRLSSTFNFNETNHRKKLARAFIFQRECNETGIKVAKKGRPMIWWRNSIALNNKLRKKKRG